MQTFIEIATMNIFLGAFCLLSIICVLLFFLTRVALPPVTEKGFYEFQRSYLIVYLLAMGGDWLQGPHVYALYDSYGMTTYQIEILFVAGFGSSMIFGMVVGPFADRYGRRANCIFYGIIYIFTCITKHFSNFWILMVGRLLGGMATSILYSAFESWLVNEHKRQFSPRLLGITFSRAVFGNSVVAIFSGFVAQKFADSFGFVAPFDLSIVVLVGMVIVIILTWPENYGDKDNNVIQLFTSALAVIRADSKIMCLGFVQSFFEASMYIFVLEWTPALAPADDAVSVEDANEDGGRYPGSIPHGHIFAAFMMAIMVGSSVFALLSKYYDVENFMRHVLLVAALSLFCPVWFPTNRVIVYSGFLVFEVCVGIFWPSMSTMRGKYVPEETRATTMNIVRVPLNMIVVLILLSNLPRSVIFQCCSAFLFAAAACQHWLFRFASVRSH